MLFFFFCGFPVPAFRDVIDIPLVVRRLHKSREEVGLSSTTNLIKYYVKCAPTSIDSFFVPQVRKELGVKDNMKLVIFNFGGQVNSNCHVWLYIAKLHKYFMLSILLLLSK